MKKQSLREMVQNGQIRPEDLSGEERRKFDQFKTIADQYKGKSRDELTREIERLGGNQNIRKVIDSGKLDSFANALRPMLGREQLRQLDQILGKLKK